MSEPPATIETDAAPAPGRRGRGAPLLRYALRRLAGLVPTLLGVTLLTFVLFDVVGGSPAAIVLGKNATKEQIAEYDHVHGYDRPLAVQYVRYLGDLARGDLGESLEYREPVAKVLRDGVGVSLSLTVPIPLWGFEDWTYLLLPILVGVLSSLGSDVRFYRTAILDEIGRPYVRTAIAKGLSPMRILVRHVLRNSLIPVVTNVSLAVPFLFTGSILLESFYGIPGLGGIGLNAVYASDFATVRAVVLVSALLYQLANLLADLAYAWLDPQVRLAK